jgi:hypothetical protein
MNTQPENTGYSFEGTEEFSWNKTQLSPEYQKVFNNLDALRESCQELYHSADEENKMLLEMMTNMLDGLERAFSHHFDANQGHVFSPKSDEPWD